MGEWSQNITDAATALLTIAFMGGIGYVGGNSIQVLRKEVKRNEHIGIVVFVILLAGWIVFKYSKTMYRNRERP
jgi:membrane protein DedA with SNARE-associated domain